MTDQVKPLSEAELKTLLALPPSSEPFDTWKFWGNDLERLIDLELADGYREGTETALRVRRSQLGDVLSATLDAQKQQAHTELQDERERIADQITDWLVEQNGDPQDEVCRDDWYPGIEVIRDGLLTPAPNPEGEGEGEQ